MRRLLLLLALVLAAPARAEILGQVVDADGRPVPDAELFTEVRTAEAAPARPAGGELWSARAGADGRFTFQPYVGFHGYFLAIAPGMALGAMQVRPPFSGMVMGPLYGERQVQRPIQGTIRLQPERLVVGRILGPDGRPVNGAVVSVAAVRQAGPNGGCWINLPAALRERYVVRTDAEGVYRLPGLYPKNVMLQADAPGLAVRRFDLAGNPPDQRLDPACRIRGRLVEGERGLPNRVIGVDLGAFGPSLGPFWEAGTPIPDSGRAVTDAEGRFELSGLPPGEYEVHPLDTKADDPKKVAVVAANVSAESPEADVLLRAIDPGVIVGRTVDPATGAPRPRIPVWVEGPEHCGPRYGPMRGTQTYSDAGGSFRVRVAPGKARLWPSGFAGSAQDATEVTVAEGGEVEVDLAVAYGPTVTGTVYGADGKPAAGVKLTARAGSYWEDVQAYSRADGRFQLSNLQWREYALVVDPLKDGTGLAAPIRVQPILRDLRVDLVPLTQVTLGGRVVDGRGRPAAHVPVQLVHVIPQPAGERRDGAAAAHSDAEGRYQFTVTDLSGRYEVTTPYCAPTQPGGRAVLPAGQEGERRFTDLVVVPLTSTLAGRVVDAAGQPAAGVAVHWVGGDRYAHGTVTDAAGRFRLTNMPSGPALLLASDERKGLTTAWATPGRETVLKLAGGK